MFACSMIVTISPQMDFVERLKQRQWIDGFTYCFLPWKLRPPRKSLRLILDRFSSVGNHDANVKVVQALHAAMNGEKTFSCMCFRTKKKLRRLC
jgi:hypothetical protein